MGALSQRRDEIVEEYLPLVRAIASRLGDRREPLEDLVQIGIVGLLKAIDGYQPERGTAFRSYAIPFVLGEIRHHLRDRGDFLRIPRPIRQRAQKLNTIEWELAGRLGRAPTTSELSQHSGLSIEEVIQAREMSFARRVASLDGPLDHSPFGTPDLGSLVGHLDAEIEGAADRNALEEALEELSERERIVVGLRFIADFSQTEVARRLGCSQMQISRLQASALLKLRASLSAAPV